MRVYLWCQISKGKTKKTLECCDALNEAIITLLYLQKGTTSGVILLKSFCRCCICSHTHLSIIQHELHASCDVYHRKKFNAISHFHCKMVTDKAPILVQSEVADLIQSF